MLPQVYVEEQEWLHERVKITIADKRAEFDDYSRRTLNRLMERERKLAKVTSVLTRTGLYLWKNNEYMEKVNRCSGESYREPLGNYVRKLAKELKRPYVRVFTTPKEIYVPRIKRLAPLTAFLSLVPKYEAPGFGLTYHLKSEPVAHYQGAAIGWYRFNGNTPVGNELWRYFIEEHINKPEIRRCLGVQP